MDTSSPKPKSPHAEREEKILAFWKEKGIFDKSLAKPAPEGEFVFYEGPPTANGRPGIHHLEARAFKDAIPRYKTMQGYHVRRKGGWDTHGLPVELAVEKELGLKSKKEIETYGIAAFNEKCKADVWKYVHEWEDFTNRIGYWIDLKDPYITYKPDYIESLWNIVKRVDGQKLLYKDYRVAPWCPRDGTVLSSHELAQGYQDVKDLSVYAKFKLQPNKKLGEFTTDDNTYILAWTTTPWTLPGNVGLAINPKIQYEILKLDDGVKIIFAFDRFNFIPVVREYQNKIVYGNNAWFIKGSELVGLSYEPLYPFPKDSVTGAEKEKLANAFKVYAADFVTTADGTGIVHIAPMYGQEDFDVGTKNHLPKYHIVSEDGTFKKEAGFLAGRSVNAEDTAVEIIKDLALRPTGSLLFHKEKYEHSYPFCWRCHTRLIYYARDSWYIRMSALRSTLVKENESIHWEPDHIKEGRFGEWLREVKDWAISRERYWGTPLPVWNCDACHARRVVGSVEEIKAKPRNTYYVMRHGQAFNNLNGGIMSGRADAPHHLTDVGKAQVAEGARVFRKMLGDAKIDMVFVSPFIRTRESADIACKELGIDAAHLSVEPRLSEWNTGSLDGTPIDAFCKIFPHTTVRFEKSPVGGESYADIKKRTGALLYEVESRYQGKNILFITHEAPAFLLIAAARGLDREQSIELRGTEDFIHNGQVMKVAFSVVPHNPEYELDLHRPYIDAVKLSCACGGEMSRVKEVMDVWFDSGAMPFAQDHYPFGKGRKEEGKKKALAGSFLYSLLPSFLSPKATLAYPADFISEAIDQTRGWFYTLHAVGALMGKGKAYKNVICLGHILDAQGKKMSKSIGNVVDPWSMMDKYGADALRFWMYSVNQPGDSKNFDEKTVDETVKKVFNLAANVLSFYKMYEEKGTKEQRNKGTIKPQEESKNVLDQWIIARLGQLIEGVTYGLDQYIFLEPTRIIREFIGDLSQWYLRRSRDRFKGDDAADKNAALATTKHVLLTLSKVMAPFTPFFAEYVYGEAGGSLESVHLEAWPSSDGANQTLLASMEIVRELSSKGLEARMASKINVRQPLAVLKVKDPRFKSLDVRAVQLIKDEVNIKDVSLDASMEKDVMLDIVITPALKEEGDLRELIRAIQDMRKENGLSVGDVASLIVPADKKALVEKYEAVIKKAAGISSIETGETLSLKRI